MESDFWLGRWERGETGWHQKEVEHALIQQFKDLKPTRIFVPLCGKSLDLAWLASQGHEVLGIELAPLACETFFHENQIEYKKTPAGKFTRFQGGRIALLNGNFFDLQPGMLGPIGALYDRAALIALPPDLRVRYAAAITSLVRACATPDEFRFLQIVLQRTPPDEKGPPFSISDEELHRLYGDEFEIGPISRETIPPLDPAPNHPERETKECVFELLPRTR